MSPRVVSLDGWLGRRTGGGEGKLMVVLLVSFSHMVSMV